MRSKRQKNFGRQPVWIFGWRKDSNHYRELNALTWVAANNSEFYGGSVGTYWVYLAFTNCLFDRANTGNAGSGSGRYALRNCTVRGSTINIYKFGLTWPVWIEDCAFDRTTLAVDDNSSGNTNVTYCDYNAFVTNYNRLPMLGTHDVIVTDFNWQASWLGNYYLPSDSPLIDAGSLTADKLGLYHFTTQTDQTKENSSTVDIGYHYVAVDDYGNPLETFTNGIPDYLLDASGNGLPDAWENYWFGGYTHGGSDWDSYNQQTLLGDYQNGLDPNVIQFTMAVTNLYVNQTTVPMQINLTAGTPSYMAVLVNDTNLADASWQACTGTNLTVNLNSADGVYVVAVGLKGLPAAATQTWARLALTRDTAPPTLTLTNMPALTGARPFIDPAGYTTKALRSLRYTVVDAYGGTNSGGGMVVAQGWNPASPYQTTNWVKCVDLALALGTNWISLQTEDWAGNVAVTNFAYVFATNGDVTPPAITRLWPPEGTRISGDSFTVQGTLDDDTATADLQYTDTNGILQTIPGLVERGGNLWFENVPLAAGTNSFSLAATDAAGNVSTTSLHVIQSDVTLTVEPLDGGAMNYATATVYGTVDDPDAVIAVNGVQGVNYGYGYWEVDNVPLPPGGTVLLVATAVTEDNVTNETGLDEERQPVVFTQSYGSTLDEVEDYSYPWNEAHFEAHGFAQWTRNDGGVKMSYGFSTNASIGAYATNWDETIWPADDGYLPVLPGTRISYSYVDFGDETPYYGGPYEELATNLVDAPSVEWMETSAAQQSGGFTNGYVAYASSESNRREVRLFTGGKAGRQRRTLFDLTAALNQDRDLLMQYDHPLADFANGMPMVSMMDTGTLPTPVPPADISLGGLGNLGDDGNLWTVLPDNQEIVITPTVTAGSAVGVVAAVMAQTAPPGSSATSAQSVAGNLPGEGPYHLVHEVDCIAPGDTNLDRTTIGIGEAVTLKGMPDNTVWSVSGGGTLSATNGGSTVYTAPLSPTNATIFATVETAQLSVTFDVIPPSGLQVVDQYDIPSDFGTPGTNNMGAFTSYFVKILPQTVSFSHVKFRENLPAETFTFPDGSTYPFAAKFKPYSGNGECDPQFEDDIRDPPIGTFSKNVLFNGTNYMSFSISYSWHDEYQNQNGDWIPYVEKHTLTEFNGSTFQMRETYQDKSGSWMGPWQ